MTWQITIVAPAYNALIIKEYLDDNGCTILDSLFSDYDNGWIITYLDDSDYPRAIVEWLEINGCIVDEIDAI